MTLPALAPGFVPDLVPFVNPEQAHDALVVLHDVAAFHGLFLPLDQEVDRDADVTDVDADEQ